MLEVVECGHDRLPEIAAQYRIAAKELSSMIARMEGFCKRHGGLSKLPLLIDEVIKKNSETDLSAPPQLSLLHRVSRVVIKSQGKPSHRQDALNEPSVSSRVSQPNYWNTCPWNIGLSSRWVC